MPHFKLYCGWNWAIWIFIQSFKLILFCVCAWLTDRLTTKKKKKRITYNSIMLMSITHTLISVCACACARVALCVCAKLKEFFYYHVLSLVLFHAKCMSLSWVLDSSFSFRFVSSLYTTQISFYSLLGILTISHLIACHSGGRKSKRSQNVKKEHCADCYVLKCEEKGESERDQSRIYHMTCQAGGRHQLIASFFLSSANTCSPHSVRELHFDTDTHRHTTRTHTRNVLFVCAFAL